MFACFVSPLDRDRSGHAPGVWSIQGDKNPPQRTELDGPLPLQNRACFSGGRQEMDSLISVAVHADE